MFSLSGLLPELLMSRTCKPGVQKLDWLMECMDVELGYKLHVIVISTLPSTIKLLKALHGAPNSP